MTSSTKLANTKNLMNCVHCFKQDIVKPKAKSHTGIAINYLDLIENTNSFIRELKSTASGWVYSSEKYNQILTKELSQRDGDIQNAISIIEQTIKMKFRKGCPQGQYGELLLFNLIQHFFHAAPLLRKMPITTNPNLERHGADAIHYLKNENGHTFYLGESKCYKSKYKFNEALSESVNSILTTLSNIQNEIQLYQHDDFIDPILQPIADGLINNTLDNPTFELVCLIVYTETSQVEAPSADEIRAKIEEIVKHRWDNTTDQLYENFHPGYISRINYIVFPSWSLEKLLESFED